MVKKLLMNSNFPVKRFAGGAVIAVILTAVQLAMRSETNNYNVPILYLVIPLVLTIALGFIPMFIAFRKDKQHKEIIAWLAFCGMWVPFGIFFFLGSLIWSLCDKPAGAARE